MDNIEYKKTKCFEFTEEVELVLFNVFKEINRQYGATYMSYTFDKFNSIRHSFRTDSKWSSVYHNETISGKPIIELCPLDIESRQKKNAFIIWDLYSHKSQNKNYREIMGMREDIGLKHGLTFSTYFNGHHDALAIATEDSKNDLAMNLLLEKEISAIFSKYLLACRYAATGYNKKKL